MNRMSVTLLLIAVAAGAASARPQLLAGILGEVLSHDHHHHHHHHNRPVHGPGGRPRPPVQPIGQQQPVVPAGGGLLNGGQFGSANAAGAGNGAVVNGQAIGQGTGIANAGPGGFGIGLGIGGAIATPLGNLAFGQGESLAVGK